MREDSGEDSADIEMQRAATRRLVLLTAVSLRGVLGFVVQYFVASFGWFACDGHADDRFTVVPDHSGITWHPPDDSSLANEAHRQLIRFGREIVAAVGHLQSKEQ